jgi:predicted DsbA family dithiol-disulfide isomerase
MHRFLITLVTLAALLSACGGQPMRNPLPTSSVPTPGPLNKTANYWDLGLSVKYPENWAAPFFTDGQMLLAASIEAARSQPITQPVVAIRIIDPGHDLGLSKDATLEQIAIAVSGGSTVQVGQRLPVKVAGLDGMAINLTDDVARLYSQTVAFRMPDGRVGTMAGVAPFESWADFAPSFDQMRIGAELLKPAVFKVGPVEAAGSLAQGGITFNYPKGWIEKDEPGNVRVYRDSAENEYLDDSGYVNGPYLAVIAQNLPTGVTLQTALAQTAHLRATDPITPVSVGGMPGVQASYTDSASGQVVTFIGFPSQDRSILIVFRWTTPGILVEAVRPTLDAILQSVKFGPVSATLSPLPTAANRPTPASTPDPAFYDGLPQTSLPDGTLILGAASAPVRVVLYTDFACTLCASYDTMIHQYIKGYVRTGKARIEYRYVAAAHKDYSATAAYAVLCAVGQGKAMAMHDRLFALLAAHGMEYFTSANLAKEATALGLDEARLKACIDSAKFAPTLEAATRLGQQSNVTTLPALLIARGDDLAQFIQSNQQNLITPSFQALTEVTAQLAGKP